MKKILYAAILSVGLVNGASAADQTAGPSAPTYDWTGAYGGIVGGWGWSNQRWTSTAAVTTGNFSGDGALIGGTLGYNFQSGPWVGGVEGDISWADINATNTTTGGCGGATPCIAEVDWLGTLRARAGYLVQPQALVYLTGGLAVAGISNSQLALSPLAAASSTEVGWTIGGGAEVAFNGPWTAKLEYIYADFGQTPFCSVAACGVTVVSDYTRLHLLRVGLNYKF